MSLIIGVRFLTGRYVAARSKTDPRPEWPPHPARLYLALAAAYFECGGAAEERAALQWLESLAAPDLHIDEDFATSNPAIPTFVPTNDASSVSRGGSIQTLPNLKRHRAERWFPSTHLPESHETIFFAWPSADSASIDVHRAALERLCSLVARVGHSRSLTQVWLAEETGGDMQILEPSSRNAERSLRVIAETSGTLDRLSTAYTVPPYRAEIRSVQGYAFRKSRSPLAATTVFDARLRIFALRAVGNSPRWLSLETTLALSHTLRDAVLQRCPGPIPESISGHASDGGPSTRPHLAIFPLPFVGGDFGDGHLLGVAVATPGDMIEEDLHRLTTALEAITDDDDEGSSGAGLGFESRRFPGLGQWRLVGLGIFDSPRVNLRSNTWTAADRGATVWESVTPVVFDQHAKSKTKDEYLIECTRHIADATRRVVSDAEIRSIEVLPVSRVVGVPPTRDFPRLRRKDGSLRRHTHAVITFDREIVGPLLVGAGRYRGYGLFRPRTGEVKQ